MTERLGQPIIYENRGGGGGVIAGETVARATPDGYTLLVAAVAVMTVNSTLMKMPFDPLKDFAPITKFASVPNMLVARAAFAPRTMQEVVAYAKANPGKMNWASSGTGSAGTLSMELFRLKTGLRFSHIPYKGAGPAMLALLTNEADLLFANPGVFMPHIKAGRLRPIGIASAQRISILPDVPTLAESGYPGFESASWYGLAAPARTSPKIISFLHAETVKVLSDPDIIARLALDGAIPVGNTPQSFARELREETDKWAQVIKAAGIKM
jgi:tripartite-type tricarboxylate transporter receptor subunit TctC